MTPYVRGSLSHWLNTSVTWSELQDSPCPEAGVRVTGPDVVLTRAVEQTHDVLIIGGGITGCALAYHLRSLDPSLKILLVEARGISEGATGRNGGLMWPSLNAPWPTTVVQYGEAGAKQLIDFEMHAYQDIVGFVRSHGLEEELQFSEFPDGAYSLCHNKGELAVELADVEAQQRMGVTPLGRPLSPQELTQLLGQHSFVGGVKQDKVARLTAVRLAIALLRKAAAVEPHSNLTVLQHMRVTHITRAGSGSFKVSLKAEDLGTVGQGLRPTSGVRSSSAAGTDSLQLTVAAHKVVHCTNGYNHLLPQLKLRGWLVPVRNQVAVTVPLHPEHPLPAAAFYARNGYVYWSRRHDGRVVIGGFRDVTPHFEWGTTDDSFESLDPVVSAQLRMYLPAVFPHMFSAARLLGPPVKPSPLPRSVAAAPATIGNPITASNTPNKPDVGATITVKADSSCVTSYLGGGCGLHMAPTSAQMGADVGTVALPAGVKRMAPFPLEYEMEWSGILGFTKDRWPLVGALPPALTAADMPAPAAENTAAIAAAAKPGAGTGEYCCMGFSGHGMTRAYTCARNMAHMLLGVPLEPSFPDHVFSPDRVLQEAAPASKL